MAGCCRVFVRRVTRGNFHFCNLISTAQNCKSHWHSRWERVLLVSEEERSSRRRERTSSHLRESATRLDPGNWKRTAAGKLLQRVGSKRSEVKTRALLVGPNEPEVTSVAIWDQNQISEIGTERARSRKRNRPFAFVRVLEDTHQNAARSPSRTSCLPEPVGKVKLIFYAGVSTPPQIFSF